MRLLKSNQDGIKKALHTLERLEQHKKKLAQFFKSTSGESDGKRIEMPPQLLLSHFTCPESANGIISSGQIRVNKHGYISLTALDPIEFKSIAKKERVIGFAFFIDDLLDQSIDLYTPIAHTQKDGTIPSLISKLKQLDGDSALAEKLLCEPSKTNPSLRFIHQREIRSTSDLDLKHCSLVFREKELKQESSQRLENLGIFQLPYTVGWIRDFFIKDQRWFFEEEQEAISFFDERSRRRETCNTKELQKKLNALKAQ